jgi:hypothetical protein
MEKAVGLDDDHAGNAAIRTALGQPEEVRRFRLLRHAASIGLLPKRPFKPLVS